MFTGKIIYIYYPTSIMKYRIRNSVLSGIAFGFFFSIFPSIIFGFKYGLILCPFTTFGFGFLIFLFLSSKTISDQTQILNEKGEPIIHSDVANHFMGAEGVGGRLFLLQGKLHFKSHKINFQTHELIIEIENIKKVDVFNSLGIIPNGLLVQLKDNSEEKFIVNNRSKWKIEIEKLMVSSLNY